MPGGLEDRKYASFLGEVTEAQRGHDVAEMMTQTVLWLKPDSMTPNSMALFSLLWHLSIWEENYVCTSQLIAYRWIKILTFLSSQGKCVSRWPGLVHSRQWAAPGLYPSVLGGLQCGKCQEVLTQVIGVDALIFLCFYSVHTLQRSGIHTLNYWDLKNSNTLLPSAHKHGCRWNQTSYEDSQVKGIS